MAKMCPQQAAMLCQVLRLFPLQTLQLPHPTSLLFYLCWDSASSLSSMPQSQPGTKEGIPLHHLNQKTNKVEHPLYPEGSNSCSLTNLSKALTYKKSRRHPEEFYIGVLSRQKSIWKSGTPLINSIKGN